MRTAQSKSGCSRNWLCAAVRPVRHSLPGGLSVAVDETIGNHFDKETQIKPVTLGVIVGNRGFFPAHLCKTGRETILKLLAAEGFKAVIVDENINDKFLAVWRA